jgi:nucleotide-binding universal stress UspA family protein
MNERMKVMIAYDGSAHADAAIDDLRRAGLPRDAEVLVVSVADSATSPAISEFDLHSLASRRVDAVLRRAKTYMRQVVEETEHLAANAADRLRSQFPEWKVGSEVLQGKPADQLLQKAAEWKPDLIVVGSHGRSAIGRFFLGSVSKKIAEEADCAVRVARRGFERTDGEPIKIIAGASSLTDAERVIKAIGRRVWTGATKVRLIAVDDGVSAGRVSAVYPYAARIFDQSAESLADFGLQVSVDVKSGNPKTVLLEEAENWKADSIFIVASGAASESEFDETANGLLTSAKCTVEVVG